MRPGDIIESRYQLVRQLQTAWLAQDRASGQSCLLKPKTGYFDHRTAVWLSQVRHAGLPRLLGELTAAADETFYVFEYLDGRSFRELADEQGGRIPLDQLLPLALQTARILAFLHRQDGCPVLHLDIKPENLILTEQGQVCLIDFGAAQLALPDEQPAVASTPAPAPEPEPAPAPAASSSSGGRIALTPEYAAPELLAGHPETGSDLYALGLTLLHLLTGLPPSSCRSQPLPELLAAIPGLPGMSAMSGMIDTTGLLSRLIGRCLHTDPAIRIGSAADLAGELAAVRLLPDDCLPVDEGSEPEPEPEPEILPEGQADNPAAPLICIWDGAELGCELAAVLAERCQIMVIDADQLNPQADLLLGLDCDKQPRPGAGDLSGLDLVLSEEQRGRLDVAALNHLALPSRIRQVRVLATRGVLEHYEYLNLDSLNQVLRIARLVCDLVIILCSRFVFDAFSCLCLQAAELVLIPVPGDSGSFRRCNRAVEFLHARQQLDVGKIHYVAFPYHQQTDLSWGTMDELCGGRLLGCISDHERRRKLKSGATPYAAAMDSSCRQEYLTLMRGIKTPAICKAMQASRKKVKN